HFAECPRESACNLELLKGLGAYRHEETSCELSRGRGRLHRDWGAGPPILTQGVILANIAQFKDEASPKAKSFTELMTAMTPQFKAALPAHLKQNAERYMRLAVTEMRRNPALSKCDPYSVLGAAMVATQLGLEIGPLGRAYLIPYGTECTFVPGWKGLSE